MIVRNTVVRVLSLAISLLFVVAVKYVSDDPDAVSVNIMLTTLFFSVLRSGFTFNVLSNTQSAAKPGLCLTIDKLVLTLLVFLYSQHLHLPTGQVAYTIFAASILTLVYRKQYPGYTRGNLIPSLVISLMFPTQVTINIVFDYYHPGIVPVLLLGALILYFSYDRFFTATDRMGLVEVYYSLLLPVGGFSAISIDGIDKPLYMIASKIIDSASSVTSFVVQGNLKQARAYTTKHDVIFLLTGGTALVFAAGCLLYLVTSHSIYMVAATSMLVNICWFMYSIFTMIYLIKHGTLASKNIYRHMLCFGVLTSVLYPLGYFQPAYIVIALSASFVCSMLSARPASRPG